MTNLFQGLARGPIDHESSSVINVVSNDAQLDMGAAVKLIAPPTTELLPRVEESDAALEALYGIVVGGDNDGIYGDGSDSTDSTTRAVDSGGDVDKQGVVVCTQGRCLAKVAGGSIVVGSKLEANGTGELRLATTGDVIAIALQASSGTDIIAVDVQREGAV